MYLGFTNTPVAESWLFGGCIISFSCTYDSWLKAITNALLLLLLLLLTLPLLWLLLTIDITTLFLLLTSESIAVCLYIPCSLYIPRISVFLISSQPAHFYFYISIFFFFFWLNLIYTFQFHFPSWFSTSGKPIHPFPPHAHFFAFIY